MSWKGLLLFAMVPVLMGQMCATPGGQQQDSTNSSQDQSSNPTPSGDSTSPAATTVTGPGFSVVIPAGFTAYAGAASPVSTNFLKAYVDGQRLIVVSTQTPPAGGPYDFNSDQVRIQDARSSDSGDSLLVATISESPMEGEKLAAYAMLASGDLLQVDISPGRALTSDDQTLGTAVFRSIVLDGADGHQLQQKLQTAEPKLLGRTSKGLIVLADLTAWVLEDGAGDAAGAEMRSWLLGSAIHTQGTEGSYELMQVGRWVAVPVRSLSLASRTKIASYNADLHDVTFTNGMAKHLDYKLPSSWKEGDDVLIVHDQHCDWLIQPKNWQAIAM